MNQFQVGQKVVCINSVVGFEQYLEVKEGEIYEIAWIGPFEHYIHGSYIGVRLKGVDRGTCPQFGYENPPFCCEPIPSACCGSFVVASWLTRRRAYYREV